MSQSDLPTRTPSVISEEGASTGRGSEETVSSSAAETVSSAIQRRKRKYRLLIGIFEKLNMLFLILFVFYLSWTLPTNYGLFSSAINNQNKTFNSSYKTQNEDINLTYTDASSGYNNVTNSPDYFYQTNIVFPTHRKQSKKRRKKGKHRGRHKGSKRRNHSASGDNQEDIVTGRTLRDDSDNKTSQKSKCKNCKIRKRKGRHKYDYFSEYNTISTSVLRKIFEKVAVDTLSGGGTWSSLTSEKPEIGPKKQKWRTKNQGLVTDRTFYTPSGNQWEFEHNMLTPGQGIQDPDVSNHEDVASATVWSEWAPCSVTCGAGKQDRTRKCGPACREVESMACILPECEDDSSSGSDLKSLNEFYFWELDGFIPPVSPPKTEFADEGTDHCQEWFKCNKDSSEKYLMKSKLPACPCTYPLTRVKSRNIWDVHQKKFFFWVDVSGFDVLAYKPEAQYCIRSKLFPGTTTLAVQQCCYDKASLLITRGKGAGTPNLISPDMSAELHRKVDLLPWIICKGDWTRYNQVIPPNNVLQCQDNPAEMEFHHQIQEIGNY